MDSFNFTGTDTASTSSVTIPYADPNAGSPIVDNSTGGNWFSSILPSASSLSGLLKSAGDIYTSVTQAQMNAQNNSYQVAANKAGIDITKAILQGQVNNAQRQANASYQSGQSAFNIPSLSGGKSSMLLLAGAALLGLLVFMKR